MCKYLFGRTIYNMYKCVHNHMKLRTAKRAVSAIIVSQ